MCTPIHSKSPLNPSWAVCPTQYAYTTIDTISFASLVCLRETGQHVAQVKRCICSRGGGDIESPHCSRIVWGEGECLASLIQR